MADQLSDEHDTSMTMGDMRSHEMSSRKQRAGAIGFTMVELLVAMAIFLIISAAGFSLLAQHQPIFNQQQNLAEVNIALRNAVAQMEIDIGNAGANYYPTANIPNYPVGVVIKNNPVATSGDCRSGTPLLYGAPCFDQMSIITADINTTPMHPSIAPVTPAIPGGDAACAETLSGNTGNANATNTRTRTLAYLIPPTGSTVAQINALAGNFKSGDQILFVTNDGAYYTSAALTAAGASYPNTTSPTYIKLTYGATTTTPNPLGGTLYGYNPLGANDNYGMTSDANTMISEGFCATDWVLRLTPVTYKVDTTTDPNNPTLLRQVAGLTQTQAQQTLATQVLGFKIGAVLFEGGTTDSPTYCFDNTKYDTNCLTPVNTPPNYANNYTTIRSVMVSLIGRTNPNPSPTYKFRNTFDSGPYEIQGVSVVINPRNMSF
jgi:prepilin-type N-terminal cleavage/methylation domain-containing protein